MTKLVAHAVAFDLLRATHVKLDKQVDVHVWLRVDEETREPIWWVASECTQAVVRSVLRRQSR